MKYIEYDITTCYQIIHTTLMYKKIQKGICGYETTLGLQLGEHMYSTKIQYTHAKILYIVLLADCYQTVSCMARKINNFCCYRKPLWGMK